MPQMELGRALAPRLLQLIPTKGEKQQNEQPNLASPINCNCPSCCPTNVQQQVHQINTKNDQINMQKWGKRIGGRWQK
jgi:hypothetical protein